MPEVQSNGWLSLTKWHTKKNLTVCHLQGTDCSELVNQTNETCTISCVKTLSVCKKTNYSESDCKSFPQIDDLLFVNITSPSCINCNNPVKKPKKEINSDYFKNISGFPDDALFPSKPGESLDPGIADKVMSSFTSDFVSKFNESMVAVTMGDSITGVLVKQDPKDMEEVSFGYARINESFNICNCVQEAFELAMSLNISEPFAAVFRFLNMSKDEYNNSVLGDEVIAIEMGAAIKNLTDTINVNFWNFDYTGIPTCNSWNGSGSLPVWNNDGCETFRSGNNITCRCTHMTFFAILLTPLNDTISTYHLNTLTTITRVGCGISMFFLGIILFMHFVMRRARSSNSTQILIHLVVAMFLLVFSFLINDFVAKTKNAVGCKIMAASMHYFMLSTFTWFAVHAFHLCLQLYSGGKIQIQRYVLKVSVVSWVLPGIIAVVLLSVGKYGEVSINTDNPATGVSMCWLLDNTVHYIVNIGFYALVFLFTFSTFVLMLTWLYCVRKNPAQNSGSSCQRMLTVMGLCCILGVTWSCAFFAYGDFRVPAYYCFTVLNSFQGFCLFIYYHKTSRMVETKDPHSSSSSNSNTLKTNLDEIFNPYDNVIQKPKPE
ncbi:hypothetical protein WMY93_015574 [Mugilogobius chulae]|uniref:Adhesion G-protein coupled receptor G2-like n=1 Tax=Mugilogobius chulae TaxID=88201 RepID=A0AAW0NRL8_9GOBI